MEMDPKKQKQIQDMMQGNNLYSQPAPDLGEAPPSPDQGGERDFAAELMQSDTIKNSLATAPKGPHPEEMQAIVDQHDQQQAPSAPEQAPLPPLPPLPDDMPQDEQQAPAAMPQQSEDDMKMKAIMKIRAEAMGGKNQQAAAFNKATKNINPVVKK
jgi:hypothetical protein